MTRAARLPLVLSIAALVVAVLGSTSVGEAAKRLVLPRNSVGTQQIKNRSIRPVDLSRQAIRALTVPPTPARARGVAVELGAWKGKFRIRGANLSPSSGSFGEVIGQIRYTGGLSCPVDSITVRSTFFDAGGRIVGTGSFIHLDPTPVGVWLPMNLLGDVTSRPVRAELVLTSVGHPLDCTTG